MKVYLFEMDSVRNSQAEIMIGQKALYEELVKNGNTVVMSLNQLTDSQSFLSLLHEDDSFEQVLNLFKMGAIKISLYGNKRTASQYIQDAIQKSMNLESDAFIFSGLPIKANDKETLHMLNHALRYSDLKRVNEYRNVDGLDEKEKKRRDYIYRFIRMILILSVESLANNEKRQTPGKDFMSFMKLAQGILASREHMENVLALIDEIEKELLLDVPNETPEKQRNYQNNRSNWINHLYAKENIETVCRVEAVVNICYNYTVEDSISDIIHHYEPSDPDSFNVDFMDRLHQYWRAYQQGIHEFHKGDVEEIEWNPMAKMQWETAVRLTNGKLQLNNQEADKAYGKSYEEQITFVRKRRKKCIKQWVFKQIGKIVWYVILFLVVELILGWIEDRVVGSFANVHIPAFVMSVLDVLVFGTVGSWISGKAKLPDILDNFRHMGLTIKDTWIFYHTETDYAHCMAKGVNEWESIN